MLQGLGGAASSRPAPQPGLQIPPTLPQTQEPYRDSRRPTVREGLGRRGPTALALPWEQKGVWCVVCGQRGPSSPKLIKVPGSGSSPHVA